MTRGKYAKRAETRRDWTSVEAERDRALLAARRAEEERVRAVANAEVAVTALQAEVKKLRAHVAEQTSPALVEALDRVEKQRSKAAGLEESLRELHEVRVKTENQLTKAIAATFGVTLLEAGELVLGAVMDVTGWNGDYLVRGRGDGSKAETKFGRTHWTASQRRAVSEQGHAVQRARGERSLPIDFADAGLSPDVWIVHRGDAKPRVLVAMYNDRQAAQVHAASDAELRAEGWYVIGGHGWPEGHPRNIDGGRGSAS